MDFVEFSAKNVDDAITEACKYYIVASDSLEYEVISEGSTGFLGFNSKPAVIKARVKEDNPVVEEAPAKEAKSEIKKVDKKEKSEKKVEAAAPAENKHKEDKPRKPLNVDASEIENRAVTFLKDVLHSMDIAADIQASFDAEEKSLDVNIDGDDMGVLIGKRGQTLDSLQYLVSLVVNKNVDGYIRVKVDTENYRERRKATLENLAKNIAFKVKRTRRSVTLEPMNPYERRIIHSALQNDKYVTTHSEGEEPFRKVVVSLKK